MSSESFGYPLHGLPEASVEAVCRATVPCYARLAPGHEPGVARHLWTGVLSDEMERLVSARQSPPAVDLIAIPNVQMRSDFMAHAEDMPICGARLFPHYILNYHKAGWVAAQTMEPAEVGVHKGAAYVVTHFNMRTYGHFLLEVLPKLFVVKTLYERGFKFPIVVPNSAAAFAPMFRAVHKDFKLVGYDDDRIRLELKLGLFPSMVTSQNYDLHEIATSSLKLFARSTYAEFRPRRIFISRRTWDSFRQLDNEEALSVRAVRLGFEVVKPQELNWIDQIRLFANASHVIGEATSALHNTLFCPAAANVMSLHWFSVTQTSIAASMGHGIGYVLPTDRRRVVYKEGWTEVQHFTIDEDEFQERLESLLRDKR